MCSSTLSRVIETPFSSISKHHLVPKKVRSNKSISNSILFINESPRLTFPNLLKQYNTKSSFQNLEVREASPNKDLLKPDFPPTTLMFKVPIF